MGTRTSLLALTFASALVLAQAFCGRASAEDTRYGFSPSLRLSMGFASVERPDDVFGFAGHLSAGIVLSPGRRYQRPSDSAGLGALQPVADAVGALVDPLDIASRREGFVARASVGYDRTGPSGRAARDLVVSLEGGYGTPLITGLVGVGYLTGRVSGTRDRGLRLMGTIAMFRRIFFVQGGADFWFGGPRTEHDFRMLLGVDVLELAWFVADP